MALFFSASVGGFFDDGVHSVIPGDAREITRARHAELMDSASAGMLITANENGDPVALEPPLPDDAELRRRLRAERDRLLAASDFTQLPDSPLTDELRANWAAYRQALRDLPETVTDPAAVEWPVAPA
ncbi:tail fiber assembly protein [Novosphingobium mathurense]|uniref:Phage tail assembly chaperone protein n=1 Tax=Novosphingobium mathurense TaxID=428990 RepID=A0A1U6INB7_9SPHN|nr:tail fiber assembly protein [Novosphingobium mathurense]SLK09531.1 Phage tail assembly chaperone protein [Novosphingobium mathurense]